MQNCGLELDDLKQEAFLVLLKAMQNYNEDKSVKFTTYLCKAIKHETMKRIGYTGRDSALFKPLNSARSSIDDLVPGTDIPLSETIEDEFAFNDFLSTEADIDNDILSEALRRALHNLEEREREVITQYYYNGCSLDDLSKQKHIPKHKISYLKKRALRKLRDSQALREWKKDFYINSRCYCYTGLGTFRNARASSEEIIIERLEDKGLIKL